MTRLQVVAFDADALVDGDGQPYPDAPSSLLAAHEADLRVVVLSSPGAPSAEGAIERVPVPVGLIALERPAALGARLRAAGLRADATLHVVSEPEAATVAAAAGLPTALVDRCGRCADAAVDHRWRDLFGLVALFAAMPSRTPSLLRC